LESFSADRRAGVTILYSLALVYVGLLVLGGFFAAAQRRWPGLPPASIWQRDRLTDFTYWLFTPLVTGSLTRGATLGVAGLLAWSTGSASFTHAGVLPLWLQAILVLLLADFIGYWSHRLRHTRGFWPFHAIHHASRQLDWLAAARMHPVDDFVDNVCVGVPILLLGFDLRLFAFLGPALILHTLLVHANVAWKFGPLRFLLVSPHMHRWHHALELEDRACNFAGMFAFFDVIFGTLHIPNSAPQVFGVRDASLPSDLGRELAYPYQPERLRNSVM
jgi:sterol desaturase/sphingolipid hydroxylase (fatty acid hydroxylase superfamily)